MDKKLPKVYANRIDKKITNNKKIDYSGINDETQLTESHINKVGEITSNTGKNIN